MRFDDMAEYRTDGRRVTPRCCCCRQRDDKKSALATLILRHVYTMRASDYVDTFYAERRCCRRADAAAVDAMLRRQLICGATLLLGYRRCYVDMPRAIR